MTVFILGWYNFTVTMVGWTRIFSK